MAFFDKSTGRNCAFSEQLILFLSFVGQNSPLGCRSDFALVFDLKGSQGQPKALWGAFYGYSRGSLERKRS